MKHSLLAYCILWSLVGVVVHRSTQACHAVRAKLEFLIPAQIAIPGPETVFELRLTNISQIPLWVNKRMAVDRSTAIEKYREIWFDFASLDGRSITYNCQNRIGEATTSDYVLVDPGDVISKKVALVCFTGLRQPGTYTGVVHYRDTTPGAPRPPKGASAMMEEVVSGEFEFKVVGP
jgi:hypothetical protein